MIYYFIIYFDIIAVGRKKEYGEAESNHQQDLIDEFEKDGYILGLNKYEDLDAVLKKIKNFEPRKYKFENDKFIEKLTNYIDTGNLEWFYQFDKYYRYVIIVNVDDALF